ncbi:MULTISPECIES: hypothetical protein [Chryseobacterium]|nr:MULTISPECIES: hypothetical protein [Chryseobacterium]MBB5334886.1 hypothetical protein [Chryseobacterium koreense]
MNSLLLFGIIHFIGGAVCAVMIREIANVRRAIKELKKQNH